MQSEAELLWCLCLNLKESLRVGGVGGVGVGVDEDERESVFEGWGECETAAAEAAAAAAIWLGATYSILEDGVSGRLNVSGSNMDFLCFGDL